MNLEKIQKMLADGRITQEEYDELAKNLPAEETSEQKPPETNEQEDENKPEPIDYDKLDKILQSRLDRAMAQERKKSADLQKQLERIQREKLTDEELRNVEIEEKEKAIAEREKAITDKENRLYAVKAIKEAGLDDGSDMSLALVDFVMGADETEINDRVKSFKKLFTSAVDKAVNAEVTKRFKDAGRQPQQGNTLNGGKNPYTKEQFNLSEQMRIEIENPELATQLKVAAGVK